MWPENKIFFGGALATLTVAAEAARDAGTVAQVCSRLQGSNAFSSAALLSFLFLTAFGCETVGCQLQTRRVSPNQWKLGGEIKNEAIGLVTGKYSNFRVVLDDQIKV